MIKKNLVLFKFVYHHMSVVVLCNTSSLHYYHNKKSFSGEKTLNLSSKCLIKHINRGVCYTEQRNLFRIEMVTVL